MSTPKIVKTISWRGKFKRWLKPPYKRFLELRKKYYRPVAWLCAVGLAWLTIWGTCRPVLHMDLIHPLDPNLPFSERFKFSNDGSLSIYDTDFQCVTVELVFGNMGTRIISNNDTMNAFPQFPGTIGPSGTTTITCPLAGHAPSSSEIPTYFKTDFAFVVSYRHFLHPFGTRNCFEFVGETDAEKKVQWTYKGNKCPDTFVPPFSIPH